MPVYVNNVIYSEWGPWATVSALDGLETKASNTGG